ncbi:MAG: hypothetical protein WD688_04845 [Candidatus Binatia bacterium]
MPVVNPKTAERYTAMITGENAILWLLAFSVAAGFWFLYAIVMVERRRRRGRRRSVPNIELSASKRIEKAETAPIYAGCGFDNPEQFWENCLIRIEQLKKEIAGVQTIRPRLRQRQPKERFKVQRITGKEKVKISRNAHRLSNLVGGLEGWRVEAVRRCLVWYIAAWKRTQQLRVKGFRSKHPGAKLGRPQLLVVGKPKKEKNKAHARIGNR